MSRKTSIVGACALAIAFVGLEYSGVYAQDKIEVPLYDDLGAYHYEITTTEPIAQEYFDQGLRLYYAFNHAEAIRAFRAAQELDDNCAMCWWGEALSWGPNINMPMDTPAALAAYVAIVEAQQRTVGESDVELALIEALSVRYEEAAPEDRAHLDQAYADAMAEVAIDYPENPEVVVLQAEALMDLRPWNYWTESQTPQPGMEIALANLQRIIAADEIHPGACHFYIHAVEELFPERAVACAERLADLMPGAGHLVHMPGHIYIRVGRYLDAVKANEHAVHADETYIQDQHPGMGMYTVGYYPHNYDFMAFAAMMIGRGDMAVDSARKVTSLLPAEMFGAPGMDFLQQWSVRPLLMQVRFARWDAILQTTEPQSNHLHSIGIWHYARGRAFLAKGDLARAEVELDQLRSTAARSELDGLRMEFNSSRDLLAVAERVLAGWREIGHGHTEKGIAALERAVALEDALLYGEPPEWSVPTRQDLGAALLAADRPSAAQLIFEQDLAKFPENGWSLHGLMRSLEAQGSKLEAAKYRSRFEQVWATADIEPADI
ncbi:MAG: hypothetical protein DHS20C12_02210 [Pseudohongiella sp.]|nr:MAG: hypothetical protein DHS20C12_02210 [Pseudohongiella sp.]